MNERTKFGMSPREEAYLGLFLFGLVVAVVVAIVAVEIVVALGFGSASLISVAMCGGTLFWMVIFLAFGGMIGKKEPEGYLPLATIISLLFVICSFAGIHKPAFTTLARWVNVVPFVPLLIVVAIGLYVFIGVGIIPKEELDEFESYY